MTRKKGAKGRHISGKLKSNGPMVRIEIAQQVTAGEHCVCVRNLSIVWTVDWPKLTIGLLELP